jgi:hypothetical protein
MVEAKSRDECSCSGLATLAAMFQVMIVACAILGTCMVAIQTWQVLIYWEGRSVDILHFLLQFVSPVLLSFLTILTCMVCRLLSCGIRLVMDVDERARRTSDAILHLVEMEEARNGPPK